MIQIYHNPRCSKSRQALELLKGKKIDPEIVLYLDNPPSEKEITNLLTMLSLSPREIMRKKESEYKESGANNPDLSDKELISLIAKYPKLLERPIVVNGDKAVIGRPPENIVNIC